MKKASIFAVALALVGSASAQTPNSMHCSKPTKERTVCTFDDGRVNVTTLRSDDTYDSEWYTKDEWAHYLETFKFDGTLRPNRHTEEEAIRTTAKLCKSGVFDKAYCSDFRVGKQGPKHAPLTQKYWDCMLSDSDAVACQRFDMYETTKK
jgi:hypothetical protein